MKTFFIVSLGCAKTRVDSEYVASLLRGEGYHQVDLPEEATLLLVNTCSFIEPARVESVDTILEVGDLKREDQYLVVLGCLPQRYHKDFLDSFPEVDALLGTSNLDQILPLVRGQIPREITPQLSWIPEGVLGRQSSLSPVSAYLKLSEGCNRGCSFCAIPAIRGPQRSLTQAQLLGEARFLASQGVRELNLIAQDLTHWGRDLPTPHTLPGLLEALHGVEGIQWIRLLYLYPGAVGEELLSAMASLPRVVPYVDIPIQHFATPVLRAMRRGYDEKGALESVEQIRAALPDVFLRTTLLVGHPHEGEEEFATLLKRVQKLQFDHLGVFVYSEEEETHSATMEAPPSAVALARCEEVMTLQGEISEARLERLLGRTLPCLCEEYDRESLVYVGRHLGQAPEVDGMTYLEGEVFTPGEILPLTLTRRARYDLLASRDPGEDGPAQTPS